MSVTIHDTNQPDIVQIVIFLLMLIESEYTQVRTRFRVQIFCNVIRSKTIKLDNDNNSQNKLNVSKS